MLGRIAADRRRLDPLGRAADGVATGRHGDLTGRESIDVVRDRDHIVVSGGKPRTSPALGVHDWAAIAELVPDRHRIGDVARDRRCRSRSTSRQQVRSSCGPLELGPATRGERTWTQRSRPRGPSRGGRTSDRVARQVEPRDCADHDRGRRLDRCVAECAQRRPGHFLLGPRAVANCGDRRVGWEAAVEESLGRSRPARRRP